MLIRVLRGNTGQLATLRYTVYKIASLLHCKNTSMQSILTYNLFSTQSVQPYIYEGRQRIEDSVVNLL